MAKVVNKRDVGREVGVYIGRPSRWGNPYRIGTDGTREEVIEAYRQRLWADVQAGRVTVEDLSELDGRMLVCWCAPRACHGDVLVKAAAWATNELMEARHG